MDLKQIAAEMKAVADAEPFVFKHPIAPPDPKYRRDITVDGHTVSVMFTHNDMGRVKMYQLSIGREDGQPHNIPWGVISQIKQALLPTGTQISSALGNTVQFIQKID